MARLNPTPANTGSPGDDRSTPHRPACNLCKKPCPAIRTNADLLSIWNAPVSNIIPSAGTTTTASFPDGPALMQFYRVRARLPLAP